MNAKVVIGILAVASGTALAYHGTHRATHVATHRATQANVEAVTQTELDVSGQVRPIYAEVLSSIRGHLQAHIATSGDSRVVVDLPALPENFYETRYSGTVRFGDIVLWTVEVFTPRPADLRSPPTLTIQFDEPTEPQEGPRLIFSLDTLRGEVAIVAINGVVPSVGPLPAVIPKEDPDAAIARLTRSIIEAQLGPS